MRLPLRPSPVARLAFVVATALTVGACTTASTPSSQPLPVTSSVETARPLDSSCAPFDGQSVARLWNETLLAAIRRDFPAPVVHARNLFHVSAAMWDAWAAYDSTAVGYFVDESQSAPDVAAACRFSNRIIITTHDPAAPPQHSR